MIATPVLRKEASMARTRMVSEKVRPIAAWLSLNPVRLASRRKSTNVASASSFSGVAENSKPQCQICHKTIVAQRRARGRSDPAVAPRVHPEERARLRPERLHLLERPRSTSGAITSKKSSQNEIGELSALDQEVIDSLQEHEILSENIGKEFEQELTFGERLSDRIASFGGSWTFIMIFGAVLFVWIIINTIVLATRAFDPYPFILMNLILSCLAALQAPIIMMSQNRAEARDRARAENDYKVNLKAELEIRHLHEKIDHLLRKQYNRLFEIQQIQIELLEELGQKRRAGARPTPASPGGPATTS